MKTKIIIGLIGLNIILAVTGCGFVDKAYNVTPGAVIGTNAVEVVTPAQTNAAGVVLAASTNTTFVPVLAPSTVAPNALVTGGISVLGGLPFPYAGTAAALLAFLYSTYAAWRNKTAANTSAQLASSLVNGIEAFRIWAQSTPEGQSVDSKLKDFIQQHAEYAGVLNELSAIVNNQTGNTVK